MIKSFSISPQNLPFLIEKLKALDPHRQWVCSVIEKKSNRSLQQNKWIRGFATDLGKHLGYEPDEMYRLIMYKFCPEFITDLEGKEIRMPGHFSKKQDGTPRNTKEAAEIQDALQRWAAQLGFLWYMPYE